MPRSSALLLSVLIAGSMAACSSDTPTDPAPAPTTAPPTASVAPIDEPPGTIACGKAVRALRDATLMNPGVITDITNAAVTADAPVAEAAQTLSAAYAKAITAHGTPTEPDAVAAVSGAAAELAKTCSDSGLETVG
jgi:hypothetical protein